MIQRLKKNLHPKFVSIILAGALPIVDLFCPEIEVIRGVLWKRSFFIVIFVRIQPL